jgi:tetratricopeptide (TPR) repeat protein
MEISTPLIASQAYYMTGSYEKSLFHTEKAISMSREVMDKDDENTVAYAVWKASMFQKGAILSGQKKREKAIAAYEEVVEETTKRRDILYIMESYRMVGYLLYEQRKSEEALQNFLLSLYAGSYLDLETRRQSTFLYSANLALLLSSEVRGMEDVEIIEKQLEEWLGDDWRDLVESGRMKDAKKRRKSSVFN